MFFHIFFVVLATWLPVLSADESNQGCDDVEQFSLMQVAHRMTRKKTVAVFVSGTLQRYQRTSSATHLVAPMVKQHYIVDYYIHLNTSDFTPWQPKAEKYMSDPVFSGLEANDLKKAITDPLTKAGATIRSLLLASGDPLNMTDEDRRFINGTSMLGKKLWNCKDFKAKHMRGARSNFLFRFKALEKLWIQALAIERKRGFKYDYVIVHQDDAAWANDFSFEAFLSSNSASESKGSRGFSLMCGPRSKYQTDDYGYTDTIWILEREAALPYLTLYQHTVNPEVSGLFIVPWQTMCDSERFEKVVSDYHNVSMFKVSAATIPIQRVARMRHNGEMISCYHYSCLSEDNRTENLIGNMTLCKDH